MRKSHTSSPAACAALASALALAGCRDGTQAAAVATGPTVQLTLDDRPPRTVAVGGTVALSTLVDLPPAAWLEVRGDAVDDRGLELWAPAARYPGSELRLYLDQGQPALGLFPPVTADMPTEVAALARQPTVSLTALASVQVLTRVIVQPGLIVAGASREVAIASDQLHALPALPRGASRAQGWPLADVIDLASVQPELRTIRVEGAGDPLTFSAAAVRDPTQIIVLKQNKRGEYVVRVWEVDGRSPTRELRRVTRIVVD